MIMRTLWPLALAVAIPASLVACKSSDEPQHLDVTVNWDDTKQTIDGFGASSAFFGKSISDDIADQLFDAKKGIGLSLLRIMIGVPDDTKSDGSEPDDAKPVASSPDLATAQQALVRGAKVWATAWTPPPIWKTTNNKNGSGTDYKTNKLKTEHYGDYATYLADFVKLMADEQVPLVALSPINEPDYTASWDNAQMTPDEMATFIGENLGPTFKDKCHDVKIVAPDTASWPRVPEYLKAILDKAKDYVPIIATHPYTNSSETINLNYQEPQRNGKQFWETEWSQENMKGDTPDPTMTSAIDMMKKLHDHLTLANMSAWNWWAIYISADALADADEPKVRQNPALIQPDKEMKDGYMFKRGYALGHWARFVRPGFKRIAATDHPMGGVLIEAYRDDSGHLVLTAINSNTKTVTQNFLIEGHEFGTLTPWVTSPDDSLSAKDTRDGGKSFTYDLPAQSVVTFVSWDATQETPNQGELPVIRQDGGTDAKKPSTGGLDCKNAIVPSNGGNGGVTDFSDWKNDTWGDPSGLNGYMYGYASTGSNMSAVANPDAKKLEITGEVLPGQDTYSGTGLSFLSCTTVTSFSQVQFTISGSWPGCDMELQIKTFDQQPIDQNPAGGCYRDAGASCYQFPVKKQAAEASADPTTVTIPLADISNWSEENAAQVVGIQWQWTPNADLDPDAGSPCHIEATISDIKFVE
jgi:glucuronoarabinoxylan endo-1,4-beta-xylanase